MVMKSGRIQKTDRVCWYQNDQLHRLDGPAQEWANGGKFWYQNGLCHRLDGPAIEYADGTKCWYFRGQQIECTDQIQFERMLRLKAFW